MPSIIFEDGKVKLQTSQTSHLVADFNRVIKLRLLADECSANNPIVRSPVPFVVSFDTSVTERPQRRQVGQGIFTNSKKQPANRNGFLGNLFSYIYKLIGK